MKNTLRQVFHSSKFLTGFLIFAAILLTMWIYPLFNPGNPLEMIGVGTFAQPGTYFSLYDAATTRTETLRLPDADEKRITNLVSDADRAAMIEWFGLMEIDVSEVDATDIDALLDLWLEHYDPSVKIKGMTQARRNFFKRLDKNLRQIRSADTLLVMHQEDEELVEKARITKTDYVNVSEVANVKRLPLGTDNFGRDVLKELVSATGTSIVIGLIAGTVATLIGLTLGLLAGYVGGLADDIIMFITNIFTVIPGFVLLILISYSIGQDQRGASVVAIVIGLTSWTWTARSVRSQVISLRNRDHVNLSKLSGHSLFRIIVTDILPYIASYVVMAFILQVSSGILAEAQLSLLGLGPKTTVTPTLGLMMNWAMLYSAHTNGSWWAYFPVILTITLISFSLNLMNTGLDQVFNPTLRD
ncbi:MAG: ABC transporter permease [Oscillospiraceae bacterium]|nr:ABC transporter permease [Oscillospiraceae bacterium]MBR3239964.1 ABC transporter permease [Oscillospiraceae bacterium]